MPVRYGLIQARVKVPRARGIWPAFWMLGQDIGQSGWPGCGEIDVMEHFGTGPATVHGTVHGPGYHTVTPADLNGKPWVFDHDFYLLISVAVGGDASVPPDESVTFPQTMLIDYIRLYEPAATLA